MTLSFRSRLAFVVVALAMTAGACANDPVEVTAPDEEQATTTEAVRDAGTDAPSEGAPAGDDTRWAGWERVDAPAECGCSDGTEFHWWVREGAPDKVLFFLNGGGACFSAATCGGAEPTYTQNLAEQREPDEGIFDPDNPDNPFAGWTVVFVPYCTGDLHLGTTTHDYGDGVVIDHLGYVNGSAALLDTAARFPEATRVVVAGSSAGSAGAPLYGGLAADAWPDADLAVIADGSGAYPGTPEITVAIGALWGAGGQLPDWPEVPSRRLEDWSLHALFWNAERHAPRIRWATFNHAYDEVQTTFAKMIGLDASDLMTLIKDTNRAIIGAGVDGVVTWISPGTDHTILGKDEFYTETVNHVRFVDWITDFVEGTPRFEDIFCKDEECGKP